MENLMANLTNGTLALRNKTDLLLIWGKELAEALPRQHYIFNVSRRHFAAYIFFVLVKNVIACHGVSNLIPKYLTVLLLMTLSCFKLAFQERYFILDWALILVAWASVLVLQVLSGVIGLPAVVRYLISVAALSVMTIFSPTYSSEFVVDAFFITSLIFYIFKSMWQPFVIIFEWLTFVIMAIVFLLAVDAAFGYEGLVFQLASYYVILFTTLLIAIIHRQKPLMVLVMAISIYCVYEKISSHRH